jgi:hypothetical protein
VEIASKPQSRDTIEGKEKNLWHHAKLNKIQRKKS